MKYKVYSKIYIPNIGECNHEHIQEFDEDLNVFGRVLEYHKYMYKTFPKCDFELVKIEKA